MLEARQTCAIRPLLPCHLAYMCMRVRHAMADIGWGKYHADDAHDASARARRGAGFVIFCLVGWKGPDT